MAIAALALSACGGATSSSAGRDAGRDSGPGGDASPCPQDVGCPSGRHWSNSLCTCVGGPDAAADAPSDVASDAAPDPCVVAGGFCEPNKPENLTCPSGAYIAEFPGVDCSAAANGFQRSCCFERNSSGQLPPATQGKCTCGNVLCAAGSTCVTGTDTIACGSGDAGTPTCAAL